MSARRIYENSNGDAWLLCKEQDRLFVRHQPNRASGGTVTENDLAVFLSSERHSPQYAALIDMFANLIEPNHSLRA